MLKKLRDMGLLIEVQTPQGVTQHYNVVGIEEEPGAGTTVTIRAEHWLDMGTYAATLVVGGIRAQGSYDVFDCIYGVQRVKFVGTFTPSA
jgi:hypothetical protein